MRISSEQFESCIASLEADTSHDALGIFGPGSIVWRLDRESVIMLGGGRAALLQVAHPHVAWAITSQSTVMSDVAGRFRRTFDNVFAMTFGPRTEAIDRARRVRAIHEHVRGTIDEDVGRFAHGDVYDALDADAALWVAATLWDTSILMWELVFGPLSAADKERYYEESRRFGALFGLDADAMPQDWRAFQDYMARMLDSDTLAVGRAARDVCSHITTAPRRTSIPAYRWLAAFTAGIMPQRFRGEFDLPWSRRDRVVFEASVAALRVGVELLPASVRYFPGYLDARRRVAGIEGRDPVGELLERVLMRGLAPSRSRRAAPTGA